MCINSFVPNAHFLYPKKMSKTKRFSDVFKGVEKGSNGNKWVKGSSPKFTSDIKRI